jgi:hypothetical protein
VLYKLQYRLGKTNTTFSVKVGFHQNRDMKLCNLLGIRATEGSLGNCIFPARLHGTGISTFLLMAGIKYGRAQFVLVWRGKCEPKASLMG